MTTHLSCDSCRRRLSAERTPNAVEIRSVFGLERDPVHWCGDVAACVQPSATEVAPGRRPLSIGVNLGRRRTDSQVTR